MKTKLFHLLAVVVALTAVACENENGSNLNRSSQMKTAVTSSERIANLTHCVSQDLVAGQHYVAGNVYVYVDLDSVYVEYKTSADWYIKKTHLYVGNCQLIPRTNNGNPVPGRFPMSTSFPNGTQSVVYAIAKSSLPECFCVAAHAEVYKMRDGVIVQTETAWAQGTRFTSRNWAMFFSVCQSDCFDIEDYYFRK